MPENTRPVASLTAPGAGKGGAVPAAAAALRAAGATFTVEDLAGQLDAPTITAPQAQGDLMILPWPTTTAPGWRQREVDAALPLPDAGTAVLSSHHVVPLTVTDRAVPAWAPTRNGSGQTLGTLAVPDGCSVLISHDEHEDLRVGPGVYVLRRQRRFDAVERQERLIAD